MKNIDELFTDSVDTGKGGKTDSPTPHVSSGKIDIAGSDRSLIYSVLILRYLRMHPAKITSETLLGELSIPVSYGQRVITKLATEGYIVSTRGKHGGGVQLAVKKSIAVNDLRRLFGLSVIPFTEI